MHRLLLPAYRLLYDVATLSPPDTISAFVYPPFFPVKLLQANLHMPAHAIDEHTHLPKHHPQNTACKTKDIYPLNANAAFVYDDSAYHIPVYERAHIAPVKSKHIDFLVLIPCIFA